MKKVDCIVLGGGNLVTGKGRSNKLKGSEVINGKMLGQYIIEALHNIKDQINNIVYIGDDLSFNVDGRINYAAPSPGRGFIKSLKIGNDTLKTINNTRSDIVLVICGDIPLVSAKEIDFMLQNIPSEEEFLTIFGIDNKNLQSQYPDFNKEKRFLELEECDFIFGNAFLVRKKELESGLDEAIEVDNNGIDPYRLLKTLLNFKLNDIILSLRLLIYSNIKFLDGKIPVFLRKINKPKQRDIIRLIENTIGKKGVKIIPNSPPQLAIDYDRIYQLPFFEEKLK